MCVYTYIYIDILKKTYMCLYICMCIYIYFFIYTFTNTCMFLNTYIWLCSYVYFLFVGASTPNNVYAHKSCFYCSEYGYM